MGLADEARSLARRPGGKCSVGRLIAANPGLDDELREAFADSNLPTSWIYDALRERGLIVSEQPLGRHRNGECLCQR